jgi:hypothetical protein
MPTRDDMNKWPKKLHPLTRAEEEIREKFIKLWHEVLPQKYGVIEKFNQRYPLKSKRKKAKKSLKLGPESERICIMRTPIGKNIYVWNCAKKWLPLSKKISPMLK